jgi:hypothetical protein
MFRRIKLTTPIASSDIDFRKVSTFQSAPSSSTWKDLLARYLNVIWSFHISNSRERPLGNGLTSMILPLSDDQMKGGYRTYLCTPRNDVIANAIDGRIGFRWAIDAEVFMTD